MLGVEHVAAPEQMANPLLNNDLFDAEDSSDSENATSLRSPIQRLESDRVFSDADSNDSGGEVRNDIDSDGEDRTSPRPDASERAKPKRKERTPRAKKPKRPKRSEVQQIHSESQRIVRESSVRLPYHKPVRKSIDDFFNKKPSSSSSLFLKPVPLKRVKKLNGGLTAHKHTNGDSSKHSKLSSTKNNKLQSNVNTSQASKQDTCNDSLKLPNTPVEDFPIVENWLKNIQSPKKDDSNNSQSLENLDDPGSTEPTESDLGKLGSSEDNLGNSEEVEDSLHLTGILSQTQDESQEYTKEDIVSEKQCVQQNGADKPNSDEPDNNGSAAISLSRIDTVLGDESADEPVQEMAKKEPDQLGDEHVSAFESSKDTDTAVAKSRADNLAASQATGDNVHTPVTARAQSPSQDNASSTPVANQPPDSATKTASVAKKHQLLLEASLKKLKSFKPKLEGSPEAVIDLEGSDEESPPMNPGVQKLMNRFARHTMKTAAKKTRQVEISVVSKEVDKDGKEDLKYDKVVTTLDGEEEEDPRLKVPGAKLLKLKDSLQARMRLKREEARQKRQEAYRLDNEDLLGEEGQGEDEDKELTDQTDTDYDPDEDNIKDDDDGPDEVDEEDEEEMDEEDFDEPVRKKFEFGDEEAEVDDDEEDEEEEEEEDEDEETAIRKPAKQDDDDEKAAMASGEESSDDDDDMGRRKITPTRVKRKKRLLLDEGDEDEDEMVLKIPLDEAEKKESKTSLHDPIAEPSETSRLSAASSAKISSVTKTSSVSVGFNLDGSKTMDMFDSNTNLTSNTDTDNKLTDVLPIDAGGESLGFSWSALKEHKEGKKDDGVPEPGNLKLDSASNSLDTSFEMFGSVIPAHQPGGGMRHAGKSANDDTSDQFTPFSKQKSLLNSIPKSTSKLSELTLPVEDSQDLFREESPLPSLAVSDSQQTGETQSFHFSFEDETQSQFLDENGFLNVRPSIAKPKPTVKKLFSSESSATPNNMDELLGLCSGQFSEGSQAPRASSPRKFGGTGPFSQITKGLEESQGGMDELLQLCSGTFAKTQAQEDKDKEAGNLTEDKQDEREEGSEASFHLISDNEGFNSDEEEDKTKFKALSSDEDESKKPDAEDAENNKKRRRIRMINSSDEDEDEGGSVASHRVKKFKGLTYQKKSKMVKSNFVEAEAELSGSEFDSDENYDAEEMGDELEDDEGADQEDLGDEEQLRNQVNKVHMKALDDDDARRLRIYKELLLPDGDMHSDSKGRQRQFKWKNLNYEDSMTDLFNHNSDGEVDDDQDEDTQWRMKRFEREQWLKENKKNPDEEDNEDNIMPAEEENSQFVKLMKSAVQKNKKTKAPVMPSVGDNTNVQADKEKEKRVGTPKAIKTRGKFHGSFLHRKNEVAKIAANTVANPNGPRMSRNFVFQAVSPDPQKNESRPQVKRSTSISGSTSMAAPKAKRPRLERSQSSMSQNSIFSHL